MSLLPAIFLDEASSELGTSANNFVQEQRLYAREVGAPAWGWSATVLPDGAYCGYGCVNMDVVVPHASMLAAEDVSPSALTLNLQTLAAEGARPKLFDGAQRIDYGFRASVDWKTSPPRVTSLQLFLDQSMGFLGLVNQRDHGQIRRYFCRDAIAQHAKALIPDYQNSCSK